MDKKTSWICLGICTITSSLSGFGLSFTALKPFIISGIASNLFLIPIQTYHIKDILENKKQIINIFANLTLCCAVGVGLGIVVSYFLPAFMLSGGWAALTYGIIGAINTISNIVISKKFIHPLVEQAFPSLKLID